MQSTISGMVTKANTKEFTQTEGPELADHHFEKTMRTLEILMNQMNLMYYFERLKNYFLDKQATHEHLAKLIRRCLKLYAMIDDLTKIFKLITQKQTATKKLQGQPNNKQHRGEEALLRERLMVSIKLLLKENPVLPTAFKFRNQCLVEQLKREEKQAVGPSEQSI